MCNFLTRCGLHENYVINQMLCETDFYTPPMLEVLPFWQFRTKSPFKLPSKNPSKDLVQNTLKNPSESPSERIFQLFNYPAPTLTQLLANSELSWRCQLQLFDFLLLLQPSPTSSPVSPHFSPDFFRRGKGTKEE